MSALVYFDLKKYTVRAPLEAAACKFFTPFFSAVYNQEQLILDNLCTKQGNVGLKSAPYNQERVIMECVRYVLRRQKCHFFHVHFNQLFSADLKT